MEWKKRKRKRRYDSIELKGRYSSRELLVSGLEWNGMEWHGCRAGTSKDRIRPLVGRLYPTEDIFFWDSAVPSRAILPPRDPSIHEIPATPWPSSSWSSFSRVWRFRFYHREDGTGIEMGELAETPPRQDGSARRRIALLP